MPSSLTATKIKDTYGQLLHVDGGVTSTPKIVYDGDGTATGLSISTTGISGNLTGNVTGDVSGNAGTVTNGVYTTGDQTIGGTKTLSSNPVLSSGTANGVAYLNGSKVLTSGSALTYNGTTLAMSGGPISNSNGGLENYILSNGTNSSSLQQNSTNFYFNANNNTASGGQFIWRINSAESELMRLTSTGLGIGTSSPAAKLDVNGDSRIRGGQKIYGYLGPAAGDGYNITLGVSGTTNYIQSYNGTATNPLSIDASTIAFRTGTFTTAATLDSSGNLGLGVTPSAWSGGNTALQIGNSSHVAAVSALTTGSNYYFNGGSKYYGTGTATQYIQVAGQHIWNIAPSGTAGNAISFTKAMTLSNSGGYSLLAINATNGSDVQWQAGGIGIGTIAVDSTAGSNPYMSFRVNSSSTERMRIDSNGRIQVGATSPLASTAVPQMFIRTPELNETYNTIQSMACGLALQNPYNNNTTGYGISLKMHLGGPSEAGKYVAIAGLAEGVYANTTAMAFYTTASAAGGADNVAERMRITSTGNVGIGTSSPSSVIHAYRAGSTEVAFKATNGTSDWLFGNLSTGMGMVYGPQAQPFGIWTNNTERMRIDSSGNLLLGGTSTPGAKVMYIANATTVPASNPSGGGVLYVEGGALKYRGSSGTVTTIAAA